MLSCLLLQSLASFPCDLPNEAHGSDVKGITHKNTPAKGPVPCTEGQESLFTDIYGGYNQAANYIFSIENTKEKKIHPCKHSFQKKKIEAVVQ